ncbi:glycoside hydrolase family 44 protein [Paenibacillus daejeonensis]|uniref:glycoside hydrolase family 44 protein n=1 Tax=Paenibacillus daejeonensis TaxID=135193 RepID=UPI00036EF7C3|nr:glycoside hydrolase family 44 protein [Paenibacillus daejeonensis]
MQISSSAYQNYKTKGLAVLLIAALLISQLVWPKQPSYGQTIKPLTVYDDAVSDEFVNYSWANHSLEETSMVRGGERSIRFVPGEGQALYFYKHRVMNAGDYKTLRFWVHGGPGGGQQFKLILTLGGGALAEIASSQLFPGGVPAGEWRQVEVPLRQLGVTGLLDGIQLWGQGQGSQEPLYLDDIAFFGGDGGTDPAPEPDPGGDLEVTGLAFEHSELVIRQGQTRTAVLHMILEDGTRTAPREGVEWLISDEAVATVSGGRVQAQSPGSAVIRAAYGSFSAQLTVQVLAVDPERPVESVDGLHIFADALAETVTNNSWGDVSLDETDIVYSGTEAIRFRPIGDAALYLYSHRILTMNEYDKLSFWIHGGEAGGQDVLLKLTAGGTAVSERRLAEVIPGGIPAGEWAYVELPLTELELPDRLFDGLQFTGAAAGEQPAIYLDDIALTAKRAAQARIVEIRTDKHGLVMLPGEVQQLAGETFLASGETGDITTLGEWAVDRPEVATVEEGRITAHAEGIARITLSYGDFRTDAFVQVTDVVSENVYDDRLAAGYRNYSWHEKDFAHTAQVRSGQYAIAFDPSGWDGVWISGEQKKQVDQYYGFRFWLHGGTTGGQELLLHAYDGGQSMGAVNLERFLPDQSLPASTWTEVTVSMADLGLEYGTFDGLILQAGTDRSQGRIYIDDVSLLRNPSPGELPEPQMPVIGIQVDRDAERLPISSQIYGINFDEQHPTTSKLAFPLERWGGNQTTRYNWELDTANRAADWFFINYPYGNDDPGQLPYGSTSDRFIDRVLGRGNDVLMTIPTIGWTPKERAVSSGFSIRKYGAQESWAPELRDAGNGVRPGGELITGNDPEDTSRRVDETFATRWVEHMAQLSNGGVRLYALDNEPEIWHVTHRDVHPDAPTYDELWEKTKLYGSAIKAVDDDAQLLGPVSWGWCAYFYSSADQCADGPDRQSHGGTPFLEWYLQQVGRHEDETNVRLIDYLTVHYYSQETAVPSADESPATAKRRFQALKALYDEDFVDRSWIQEPIRLIPRMKEIIERNLPGTKLAITEYNFGNGNGITAGLAQAEALAIFGREGVDLATRFGNFQSDTPIEDAFKIYLDYDGNGSRIEGSSVRTYSTLFDAVGSYTIEGNDGKTYVLLFNKDTLSRQIDLDVGLEQPGAAELYRFSAASRLAPAGAIRPGDDGRFALTLPKRSATLLVLNEA